MLGNRMLSCTAQTYKNPVPPFSFLCRHICPDAIVCLRSAQTDHDDFRRSRFRISVKCKDSLRSSEGFCSLSLSLSVRLVWYESPIPLFVITSANSIINGPYPITALQFTTSRTPQPSLSLSASVCPTPPSVLREHIALPLSGRLQTFNFSSLVRCSAAAQTVTHGL